MESEAKKPAGHGESLSEGPEQGAQGIEGKPKGVKNGVWIRLLVLVALTAGSFVLYKSGFFKLFCSEQRLLAFLDSLGPLSFLGFIMLQAAQVVIAPIPGEITGLIGGYAYGPYVGVALSTTGLILGSYLAFVLSRSFGRPFVDKFVHKSVMARFDYLLHHKGLFLVFMFFLIPGFPKDYLCFILGLGHLTTMEFLAVSSVGRVFGTILLTLCGGYIRYHQYQRLGVLIAGALIVILATVLARRRIEQLFKAWHVRQQYKNRVKHAKPIKS